MFDGLLSLYFVSICCVDAVVACAVTCLDVTCFVTLDGAYLLWMPPLEMFSELSLSIYIYIYFVFFCSCCCPPVVVLP